MYRSWARFILIFFSFFVIIYFHKKDENNNPEINFNECILIASVVGDLYRVGFQLSQSMNV